LSNQGRIDLNRGWLSSPTFGLLFSFPSGFGVWSLR
jgi:hypothetical protein